MSYTKLPPYPHLAVRNAIDVYQLIATASLDYWVTAIQREATPLQIASELVRWLRVTLDRRPPEWATPNEIVFETSLARLRDFTPDDSASDVVATLVLPPQAGHDSSIVDFSPAQSQIRSIRESGLTRLYSLDWIGATEETTDATVEDYLDVIDDCIDRIGGPVNLIGDCQGGWLATIYAALAPERVNTLTIAGAPIDFHAGDPAILAVLQTLAPGGNLGLYQALVAAHGGVLPGEAMISGFVLLHPQDEVEKSVDLLANINDKRHVERFREFEDWFKHAQDIPGAFYLWVVEHLFRDNALIEGAVSLRGQKVSLSQIGCPLNLLAGETDHITPPAQVFAAADHVSTPRPPPGPNPRTDRRSVVGRQSPAPTVRVGLVLHGARHLAARDSGVHPVNDTLLLRQSTEASVSDGRGCEERPQMLDRVGAIRSPRLRDGAGCAWIVGLPEPGERVADAEVGRQEGVRIPERAHRDVLGRPGTDPRQLLKPGPRRVAVGARVEIELLVSERLGEREQGGAPRARHRERLRISVGERGRRREQAGDSAARRHQWLTARVNEPAGERCGGGERHLLTEHGAYGELVPVDVAGHPSPRRGAHGVGEERIGREEGGDGPGVGIEVEQPA